MELVGIDRPAERKARHVSAAVFRRHCGSVAVLAVALAGKPGNYLIADEPTTALDVTVQAQILDLLRDIQQKLGTSRSYPCYHMTWARWPMGSRSGGRDVCGKDRVRLEHGR